MRAFLHEDRKFVYLRSAHAGDARVVYKSSNLIESEAVLVIDPAPVVSDGLWQHRRCELCVVQARDSCDSMSLTKLFVEVHGLIVLLCDASCELFEKSVDNSEISHVILKW